MELPSHLFGLIELGLVFGGVLLFCVYQIWSVRRAASHARDTARETLSSDEPRPASEPAAPDQDGRRGIR